jgi:hypothetical protein
MRKSGSLDQVLETDAGIEIRPAPTYDNFPHAPKKNEVTFSIKCKYRNYCRNWKQKRIKSCMYCKYNQFHLTPTDGFGYEDNYDCWIPGIWIPP